MTKRILVMLMVTMALTGKAQTFTEKISREFSFEKKGTNNAVMIFNINGDIKVEGYTGDKIILEVTKTVNAKTEARLEKGKTEIQLGVMDRADTVILYISGVCNEFGKRIKRDESNSGNWHGRWSRSVWDNYGYNWNNRKGNRADCEKQYDYEMNFVLKVPASVNVLASTVNNGDVEVTGVTGTVVAENINGSISLKNISGATYASTINGTLDLDYSSNPIGDSKYYSLNGNINANFRKGLGAQLTFKSFNGDFYSSLDDITPMAVVVEKYAKGEGIRYKVNGNRYKVRQGGPLLDFETFNGDVYLKEN